MVIKVLLFWGEFIMFALIFMVAFLIIFILLIKLTGFENWKITLNEILFTYTETKKINCRFSDKELFMRVLDDRYNNTILYAKKEKIKGMIEKEIEEGYSILNSYNLTILIYISLIIEKNKVLKSYSTGYELLPVINLELQRQGVLKN